MKNFLLKKMNRGIALAIALVVGLIIFFIADNVAFARERPMLKDFLEEYLEEAAKVNLLPELYRATGTDIPDSVIETKTKEVKNFIENYFTEYKNPANIYGVSSKQNLLINSESMYEYNRMNGYVIKDLQYSLVNISNIQKLAADAVKIIFTVNAKISASFYVQFLDIASCCWDLWNYYNGGMAIDEAEIQEVSGEQQITLTLFKINGGWKIAEVQNYFGGGIWF